MGVNVRQMAQNPAVDKLVPADTQQEIEGMAQQIESYTGVNPLQDLEGVVLAGLLRDNMPGAIFFHGQWDRQRLAQVVSQNPTYTSSLYRNVTIHSWQDENGAKQQYAAFLADDVLVMAEGQVEIVQAIIAYNADGGESFAGVDLPSPNPMAFFVASKPEAGAAELTSVPVISKLSRVVGSIDADENAVSLRMHAAAVDEISAEFIKDALEGVMALMHLADPDEAHAWRSEVIQEGPGVNMVVSMPPEKLMTLGQALRQAQAAK
jgi:hypothetical protein